MNLPEIATAWLERSGGGKLADDARAMSRAYREGHSTEALAGDFRAYLAARLPATYAAVRTCLAELRVRLPDFAPGSLCDAGAGPGTASWAAAETWPSINAVTMLDRDGAFLALARTLAADHPVLGNADFQQGQLQDVTGRHALAVVSYALAEVPMAAVAKAVTRLWECTETALVMVEPGTPQGFARVKLAREALIREGARIAAPCVHDGACPIMGDDWCHFSVRLARSRAHMHAKQARVPFEDERYSYVIAVRGEIARAGARIVAPVTATKAELRFKLCGGNGLEMAAVPTRNRDALRRARRLGWGDLF